MRAARPWPLVRGLLLATIVGIAACGGGGGDYSNTMPTEPDLAIAKTHVGDFTAGVNGAFTLTVSNVGAGATAATITGAAAHGVFNDVAVVATPGDNNPANDTAVDQTIVQ